MFTGELEHSNKNKSEYRNSNNSNNSTQQNVYIRIKQNVKLKKKNYYMRAAHEWRKSLKSIIKYTIWIQNYTIYEHITYIYNL